MSPETAYLPPGYIYAPWVTVPSRGRLLDAVDRTILRTLKLVNDRWFKSYLSRMTNRPYNVKMDGDFMMNKKYLDAYENKKVNPDYYSTVLPTFTDRNEPQGKSSGNEP